MYADAVPPLPLITTPIPLTRASRDELDREVRAVADSPLVSALAKAFGGGLLLLNAHRQIVFANLESLLAQPDEAARRAIGLRPGEALGCVHANERPGGCGASPSCRACGALRVILGCQCASELVEGECLITAANGALQPLELKLRASPLALGGRAFTVLAIRDASDEKRRSILEQVFFHDLLNLITPLSHLAQMMPALPESRLRETGARIGGLVRRITAEIQAQRSLLRAEHGTLEISLAPVTAQEALDELAVALEGHPLVRERHLELQRAPPQVRPQTDRTLLLRVLTNMVTNALEATVPGGSVRVWCEEGVASSGWACALHVENEAVMPPEVAAHVFQRSFSTKANRGRGLGTYSMKLLGERYLGGSVGFVSREGQGTVFTLRLPRRPPAEPGAKKPASPTPCF